MADTPCLLVIGYGNSLRRDDGAGLLLAEMLHDTWQAQGRPVRLILAHQLSPEMAVDIAAPDVVAVLFVDASVEPPDSTPRVALTPVEAAPACAGLTHHLTPATLLLYAARLFDHHPRGWLLRISGQDFGHGESLSPAVAAAVAEAGRQADRWWAEICAGQHRHAARL